MAQPVHFKAVVERVERHSPDVATYVLRYAGRRPRFKPGQFVHLALDEYDPSSHWPDSRVFSIASGSQRADLLRLTISRQGKYTARILDEVREGRELSLKGPYGEFVVRPRDADDHIVLVAGGTGITPFCAFMEDFSAAALGIANPVHLYYGARSSDLLIYRSLVEECARAMPKFRVTYYVEEGAQLADFRQGRIDIAQVVADLRETGVKSNCTFYLSGPKVMIAAFSSRLTQELGTSPSQVMVDAWE